LFFDVSERALSGPAHRGVIPADGNVKKQDPPLLSVDVELAVACFHRALLKTLIIHGRHDEVHGGPVFLTFQLRTRRVFMGAMRGMGACNS